MVDDILNGSHTIAEKEKLIKTLSDSLSEEIKIGYRYCKKCGNYYREKAWDTCSETKTENVCVYEDPINSGGNDYEERDVTRHYSICPMGHKEEIKF